MKPLSTVVVGLGQWGQKWMANVSGNKHYRLDGVVDARSDILRRAGRKFGIPTEHSFETVEQALDTLHPEVTIVVVPPEVHKFVVLQALAAGSHVLSEKPLANDIAEAKVLRAAIHHCDRKFMVSQDYRWQPPIQALREALAQGLVGRISHISCEHRRALHIGGWREQMEEVLLEDMSIHHFDILRYVTGLNAREVFARSFNPPWSWYKGGAVVSAQLELDREVHVDYVAEWVTQAKQTSWMGNILIQGEKGAIQLTQRTLTAKVNGKRTAIRLPRMKRTGRDFALMEFYQAISQDRAPETSVDDNIQSYAMTRAAIQSSRTGFPVRLTELLD